MCSRLKTTSFIILVTYVYFGTNLALVKQLHLLYDTLFRFVEEAIIACCVSDDAVGEGTASNKLKTKIIVSYEHWNKL